MSYACKDRVIQSGRLVQDGCLYNHPAKQVYKWLANPFAGKPPCGHDLRDTDERCDGCKLRGNNDSE